MISGTSLLGQLLVKAGLITEAQLNEALRIQRMEGKRLSSILVRLGYISEPVLVEFFSRQYNTPVITISEHDIDPTLIKVVPYETVKRYQLIPISREGASLRIAMADPSNNLAIDDVRFLTGMKVSAYVAPESSIMEAIERYYQKKEPVHLTLSGKPAPEEAKGKGAKSAAEEEDLSRVIGSAIEEFTVVEEKEDKEIVREVEAPIVKLVNGVMLNAISSRASDIHIEPAEDSLRVRYRIDGVLHMIHRLPVKIKNAITARVKIMAHLDISERRLPQDGRIKLKLGEDRAVDFRVSTLPTQFGEKVVMRILDKTSITLDIAKMGFDDKPLNDVLDAIERPYGMILVTGPTGSGKTTTLYAALSRLNKPGVNIITVEDPIEYSFFGISQVQVKEEIGLTFASSLRSFLRQDPDIIMVGEIRDFETAEIAVKAALTGHLVLSTLHTNDAPSTITRLTNMGIEPFLVSSSVILIMAQRLVRRVCENCKVEQDISETALLKIGFPRDRIKDIKCYMGSGCPVCNKTGYKGRIALYEVMPLTAEIKELILQGASALEIKKAAVKQGMATLRQSGINKVIEGITSIEELLRVTFED